MTFRSLLRHLATMVALTGLLAAFGVQAQTAKTISQDYDNAIKAAQTITALGPDLFGESVDLKEGRTSFGATDVSVRTNSGLPLMVGRSLGINSRDIDAYVDQAADGELFGNWKLDVPTISGVYDERTGWVSQMPDPQQRCSASDWSKAPPPAVPSAFTSWSIYYYPEQYWRGNTIHIPGKGSGPMLYLPSTHSRPTDGRTYFWTTKNHWRIACVPLKNGPGEGFLVVLPDGTRYTFDWMSSRKAAALKDTQCRQSYTNDFTVTNYPGQWVYQPLPTRLYDPNDPSIYINPIGNLYRRVFEGGGGSASGGSSLVTVCPEEVVVNRREYTLQVTKAEDRFGNSIVYDYDPANPRRLRSILSSDGRSITLQYGAHGKIIAVSTAGRTWQYQYADPNGVVLSAVVLPDGSRWSFEYGDLYSLLHWDNQKVVWADCEPVIVQGATTTMTIRHPSGAQGLFTFRNMLHGTDRTPGGCYTPDPDRPLKPDMGLFPKAYKVASLISKQVSGPGLTPELWSYVYHPSWSWNPTAYVDDCSLGGGVCDSTSSTDVIGPDGTVIRSVFGNDYYRNNGQLLRVETISNGLVMQTVVNEYLGDASAQAYPARLGWDPSTRNNPFETEQAHPQTVTTLTRDGVSYISRVAQTCAGGTRYCFDAYVRPTIVQKYNSLGTSRTDLTEYRDFPTYWLLGQVERQTNADTGMVEAETLFNAAGLPQTLKKFGAVESVLAYDANGNLASVADGRGNIILTSVWKCGIPQSIRHPATSESPAGATESAAVDDHCWITSTTDENGYTTGYGYDAMGRLAGIAYPTGDNVDWLPKQFDFRALTDNDWKPTGIVTGQWRHYEGQGNQAKFTFYDVQWRPVLVMEYDTSNPTATLRYTRSAYDSNGRLGFQSYPVVDPASTTTGVRTQYDALDRVVRIDQDSEQNVLTTTTEYLPGLMARVTNPRGQQTITSFMAWDSPGYELPIASVQPEGKVIEIARHPQFGWPLRLKQRNSSGSLQHTRYYVYDDKARLCKTIEPETGTTVVDYDNAGNAIWQAAGLGGGDYESLLTCSRDAAASSGRKVARNYDTRNKLTTLAFPDGRGDQIWTYTPDGLPATVVTYNGPNQTEPVVNAYHYNKRRMLDGQGDSVSQPGWYTWGIGYGYDRIGNLSHQTYPTGLSIDYAPNALGQATRAGSYATGAVYHPNGALKQFTYGNGIVHTMQQNARQLPSRVTSAGVSDYAYNYDRNGNVTNIWDQARGDHYSRWLQYDNLDRLTAAGSGSFGGDAWHRFTYDALDNLTSWKLAGVKDYAEYVYDWRNRLIGIKDTAGATVVNLWYDAQGNLGDRNGQLYAFDYGNRLRHVTGKEYYRYDAYGRRAQTIQADGKTTLWQYSQGGQLMFSWDWAGAGQEKTHEYVHLAGSVVATIDHRWPDNAVLATRYQHTDALGSPIATTNESGQVVERLDYEPWGAVIGKPTHAGIGYTGHVMDGGTGLTYMQQRYYDQSIGRFLSVDPVVAIDGGGRHFNRYVYAFNSPYRYTDPDGRAPPGCGDGTCESYDRRVEQAGGIAIGTIVGMVMAIDGVQPGEEMGLGMLFMEVSGAGAPKPVVTAKVSRGFRVFRDVNQTARVGGDQTKKTLIAGYVAAKRSVRMGNALPNGNMATAHAEIGALQQAYDAGVTQGAAFTLTVTGKPICSYCLGDIAKMAELSGLKSLRVHEKATGRQYYWTRGMRRIRPVEK